MNLRSAPASPNREDALDIARRASAIAKDRFRRPLDVQIKADASPVTQADLAVEDLVRQELTRRFPHHGIFGEEFGKTGAMSEGFWIVDPIDGTRSFLSGQPLFGFLLGFFGADGAEIGLVGMPALDEFFVAETGCGAFLNGQPVRASGQTELGSAILYINEGERIWRAEPAVFAALMSAGQTRRLAYDCYPHALVAAGHVDAVVDYGLAPYDFLPVSVLVREAGGVMTDWDGAPLTVESDGRTVTAATPALHAQLLQLLQGARCS